MGSAKAENTPKRFFSKTSDEVRGENDKHFLLRGLECRHPDRSGHMGARRRGSGGGEETSGDGRKGDKMRTRKQPFRRDSAGVGAECKITH